VPTAPGSYDPHAAHRSFESEVTRLQSQALVTWSKEATRLEGYGLRDGMSVLEIGCGPGFVTRELLGRWPRLRVTGLELDADLARQARKLNRRAGHRVRVVEGSILDAGLRDRRFDFAIARLVFQHLTDPLAAAREAFRVLKPGGKLVVVDVDDALWGIADPVLPELAPVLHKSAEAQTDRGGNRLIGRRLWRLLLAAGFVDPDLDAVLGHSDELGLDPFRANLDADRFLPLVEGGVLSDEDVATARAAYERFVGSPAPFVLTLYLVACGMKPRRARRAA
jgi:SAM-dependent methyltransferase